MRGDSATFKPDEIESFRFVDYDYDESTATAVLDYSFDDTIAFRERFTFPASHVPHGSTLHSSFEHCLRLLHIAGGVSYYKAAAPRVLRVETGPLTPTELNFARNLYQHGLGEYSWNNQLDLTGRLNFECSIINERQPAPSGLPRMSAIPVGGGKDSIVSVEAVKRGNDPAVLVCVNGHRSILEIAEIARLPLIQIEREISANLFDLNSAGAYNGHVPVTAINSLAIGVGAFLYGYDTIIMSNERSASVGNFIWNGNEINHQYSKSLDFENLLANLFSVCVSADLRYFSLLRPLSELDIAGRFSAMSQYHSAFTSCNAAFRIDESRRAQRWCCNCPKCRFVFLALAPFMNAASLEEVFGKNLLDDISQAAGFDELIGVTGDKPFECVGELEECVAAFVMLSSDFQWNKAVLVERFATGVSERLNIPQNVVANALVASAVHNVPPTYLEWLDGLARPPRP